MALSGNATIRLMDALADKVAGAEVASAVNSGAALVAQSGWTLAAIIVAAHTSQTTDFAALAVGDQVAVVPASAGNSHFVTVATAGTLGEAAVVGSLYVVLRAFKAPAAITATTPVAYF